MSRRAHGPPAKSQTAAEPGAAMDGFRLRCAAPTAAAELSVLSLRTALLQPKQ